MTATQLRTYAYQQARRKGLSTTAAKAVVETVAEKLKLEGMITHRHLAASDVRIQSVVWKEIQKAK